MSKDKGLNPSSSFVPPDLSENQEGVLGRNIRKIDVDSHQNECDETLKTVQKIRRTLLDRLFIKSMNHLLRTNLNVLSFASFIEDIEQRISEVADSVSKHYRECKIYNHYRLSEDELSVMSDYSYSVPPFDKYRYISYMRNMRKDIKVLTDDIQSRLAKPTTTLNEQCKELWGMEIDEVKPFIAESINNFDEIFDGYMYTFEEELPIDLTPEESEYIPFKIEMDIEPVRNIAISA